MREDERDHTRAVDLHRNVGALRSAYQHATPYHAFSRILNGDTTLPLIDIDDTQDGNQPDEQENDDTDDTTTGAATRRAGGIALLYEAWNTAHDSTKDDDRDTVANALFCNQFADPDQDHGASRQRKQDGQRLQPVARIKEVEVCQNAELDKDGRVTNSLQECQRDGDDTRDLAKAQTSGLTLAQHVL